MKKSWIGPLCACVATTAPTPAQTTPNLPRVEVVEPASLPGIGVACDRMPYTVESLGRDAINNENAVSLPELIGLRLPSVNLNEIEGNPFQPPRPDEEPTRDSERLRQCAAGRRLPACRPGLLPQRAHRERHPLERGAIARRKTRATRACVWATN